MSLEASWARQVLAHHLQGKELPQPPQALKEQVAACFVTLHDAQGNLRGCIGSLEPMRPNLAEEIYENAQSAALRDPRFPPVSASELDRLSLSVDVLSSAEAIADESDLDPARYGVIVQEGFRRGVLLPDLEGIDDVETQITIAKQKAGIPAATRPELFRFRVERHYED